MTDEPVLCVQRGGSTWSAGDAIVIHHRGSVFLRHPAGRVESTGFEATLPLAAVGALSAALRCAQVAAENWRAAHPPDPAMEDDDA